MNSVSSSYRDGPLVTAVDWVASALLGSAATAVAVLSVASIGFLMLSGRLPLRRGASVILGCFILFSAGGVASGILGIPGQKRGYAMEAASVPDPLYLPTAPTPEPYDPYSGAAVPDRRVGDLLD